MEQRSVIVILGQTGSGKTYLTRKLINAAPHPVVIADTMDQFHNGIIFNSYHSLLSWLSSGKRNLMREYTLKVSNDAELNSLVWMVRQLGKNCTLVLDEASLLCQNNRINEDLDWIVKYGRHQNISIIANARRSVELHPNLRAMASCIVSFRQTEAIDIQTLRKTFSGADRLPTLQKERFEYLVMGDYRGTFAAEYFESDPLAIFP